MSAGGKRNMSHRLLHWSVAAIPAILVATLGACMTVSDHPKAASTAGGLAPIESFSAIADPAQRSAALFVEAGKVLQSPRCLNCHPVTRSPTQGNDLHPHIPPISSNTAIAAAGLPCGTCHQTHNSPTASAGIRSIPGAEHWGLAPA